MNYFARKALSISTINVVIRQHDDAATGVTHMDIEQTSLGGLKGITERRVLDWTPRETESYLFGKSRGKSRWVDISEVEDEFLKMGFEEGTKEVLEGMVENLTGGWTAVQTWGFEIIDGRRHYVRHVVSKKGDLVKTVKMVYDWQGRE
jgi:hypothetical protein